MVNHSRKAPNAIGHVKKIKDDTKLYYTAIRDIEEGEEILYDYGIADKESIEKFPWLLDWYVT